MIILGIILIIVGVVILTVDTRDDSEQRRSHRRLMAELRRQPAPNWELGERVRITKDDAA